VPRTSAGLLIHRTTARGTEVLLVHPGGPYWARRDAAAWSVPKGECAPGEDPRAVADREFAEEIGSPPPQGEGVFLGRRRQSGGKLVLVWALPGDLDVSTVQSNTFEMEWPPRSGELRSFPEVDRAGWFTIDEARTKLHAGQVPFLDDLLAVVGAD
jgi:predicted NUDIX family NTP pyrophosphohydrolase